MAGFLEINNDTVELKPGESSNSSIRPIEVTGKTMDELPVAFSLKGTTTDLQKKEDIDKPFTMKVTRITIGDPFAGIEYDIKESNKGPNDKQDSRDFLEIKIKNRKLSDDSLNNIKILMDKGTLTTGIIFKKTIKHELVNSPERKSLLEHTGDMKAALAQANEPAAAFKSTANAALPAKSKKNGISIA